MDYYMIGKRIREERNKLSLTQEQLAARSKISTNFLACIENGIRKGSFETYANIVNALGTTLDQITQDSVTAAKGLLLKNDIDHYLANMTIGECELIARLLGEYHSFKKEQSSGMSNQKNTQ